MADVALMIASKAIVLLIVGAILWGLFRLLVPKTGAGSSRHCMTCGTDSDGKLHTRGSIWIELVLWCCFVIPGLIYSIWRHTSRSMVCHACGSHTLVPGQSPAAVAHRRTLASPQ